MILLLAVAVLSNSGCATAGRIDDSIKTAIRYNLNSSPEGECQAKGHWYTLKYGCVKLQDGYWGFYYRDSFYAFYNDRRTPLQQPMIIKLNPFNAIK
jgi:hypothetical protein